MNFKENFDKLPKFCPENVSNVNMDECRLKDNLDIAGQIKKDMPRREHASCPPVSSVISNGVSNGCPVSPVSSNRKVLDERRNLVLQLLQQHGYYPADNVTQDFQLRHEHVFSTKWSLQMKIREVRQKLKLGRYIAL